MLHDINKRTLGLNFTSPATARVIVWAPFAESVLIEIRDIQFSLEKQELGYWRLELSEIKQGDIYYLIVDGKKLPDPTSLSQPEGVHSGSRAVDLSGYKWNDKHWKGADPNSLIIYELHTGTFSNEGTFNGIAEKLSYLKDLGINAIELMPVAQFPGTRNWGYDGVFLYAVQNSYGGCENLQRLVDKCHNEGIAVILDVVYNHLGPEGNYLASFGPYFTDKYRTPWGKAVNYDDEWCDGVRKFITENVIMWFRDFHIDGLRLDAVHAIWDFSANHIMQELKENTLRLNEAGPINHFLIAESDLNDIRYLNTFGKGGYNLDLQWCDEFHHSIHALVTGERTGYYSDFGSVEHVCLSLNNAFVYNGRYSEFRKRTFGSRADYLSGDRFVVFSQNHDQIGNRPQGERLSSLSDEETLKLVAGAVLFSPYTPLIFMGEEYGEQNPFLYFTSHGDRSLINAVREGRRREFSYFEGKVPDPQSVSTFKRSTLKWDHHTSVQSDLHSFYRKIIQLRKEHPLLHVSERKGIEAKVVSGFNAIILTRRRDRNFAFCVFNFGKTEVKITLKELKNTIIIINSARDEWKESPPRSIESDTLTVASRSFVLVSDVTY